MKSIKPVRAWAVVLPGTNRITGRNLAHCPDGKTSNTCLVYDIYERKAAAEFASEVYPDGLRFVIPVLISPIRRRKK